MKPRSALLVGAHPDDWALGAFGTAFALSSNGWSISCLTLSSGEAAGKAQQREAEEIAVAKMLGAKLVLGRLSDGSISHRTATSLIEYAIDASGADFVLAHGEADSHQDHVAVARAAISACRRGKSLFFYESPSSRGFIPTLSMDITLAWPRKIEAIRLYGSQLQRIDLGGWADLASRFRGWPLMWGRRVEAFVPFQGTLQSFFLEDGLELVDGHEREDDPAAGALHSLNSVFGGNHE